MLCVKPGQQIPCSRIEGLVLSNSRPSGGRCQARRAKMKRNIRIFYATIVLGALALLAMLLVSMVFASPAIPRSGQLATARASQPFSPMSGHWVVVNAPNVGTGDN